MNSMRMHRESAAGFTLVELMVVILIVAAILAYGIPSYKSVTTQNRMGSEINDLSNDVELARSGAIKQGMYATICASTNSTTTAPTCSGSDNWSTGWIVFTDITGNQTYPAAGDTLLRVHGAMQNGDTLTGETGAAGSVSALTFNRMGGVGGPSGAFTLTPTTFDVLSLHDSANTLAWRRCLQVTEVGTSTLNTQIQDPGVCP